MSIGGYVAYTLYVGAAFADANGDQTRLLRTKLPPMLARMRELSNDEEQWKLAAQSLFIRLHEVMGREWRPTGKWAEQIEAFLGENKDAVQE